MNQIVRIFRKDCRRLWQMIAAVLLFTFLHGYGDVAISPAGHAIGFSPYVLLFILVSLSGLILPVAQFLLVISVIQEESLVGSNKFWLTRPYDRRSLFLEKLLFVVGWILLPMLLHDLFVIRHFGFSLSSASGLLLWKTAQFIFFLLVAATFAVLSASFARAVLLAVGMILVSGVTFLIVLQEVGGPPMAEARATYIMLALLALAAVGAVGIIVFQYRFRITPVAAAFGVITILACALLARFWPPALTSYLSNRYTSPLVKSVQLFPDSGLTGLTRPPTFDNASAQAHTVYFPFRATGLAKNVGVAVNGASAEFSPSGQKQYLFYLPQQVRFLPSSNPGIFADAGGLEQLVPFSVGGPGGTEPLTDTDGILSGKLYLEGFRSSVAKVPVPLPYQPQQFAISGRHCSVQAGQREGSLILWFDCVELEPGTTSRMLIRLLQDNHEIIPNGSSGRSSGYSGWPSFLSPIVRTNFDYEFSRDASADVLNGAPKQGREMLIFVEEILGRQERPFRIDHFHPADLSLQAWEQRGVLGTESTSTQSNNGIKLKAQ